jgi:hypothetical protein
MLMFVSCLTTLGKILPVSCAPSASLPPSSVVLDVEVEEGSAAAAAEAEVVD